MSHEEHHGELLNNLAKEYKDIFESSHQAIYVYLDDNHFTCNKKFASILGYGSTQEIEAMQGDFLGSFVNDESKDELVSNYQKAIQKFEGSTIKVTWKKKNGDAVPSTVIMVPISYEGHLCALHFIS